MIQNIAVADSPRLGVWARSKEFELNQSSNPFEFDAVRVFF
jgi:hypothetical protein